MGPGGWAWGGSDRCGPGRPQCPRVQQACSQGWRARMGPGACWRLPRHLFCMATPCGLTATVVLQVGRGAAGRHDWRGLLWPRVQGAVARARRGRQEDPALPRCAGGAAAAAAAAAGSARCFCLRARILRHRTGHRPCPAGGSAARTTRHQARPEEASSERAEAGSVDASRAHAPNRKPRALRPLLLRRRRRHPQPRRRASRPRWSSARRSITRTWSRACTRSRPARASRPPPRPRRRARPRRRRRRSAAAATTAVTARLV